MEKLPVEIIVKIFQNVDSAELLWRIPNVCQQWRSIVRDRFWNKVISLTCKRGTLDTYFKLSFDECSSDDSSSDDYQCDYNYGFSVDEEKFDSEYSKRDDSCKKLDTYDEEYKIKFDNKMIKNLIVSDKQMESYLKKGLQLCSNVEQLIFNECKFSIREPKEFKQILVTSLPTILELQVVHCDIHFAALVFDVIEKLNRLTKVRFEMPNTRLNEEGEILFERVNKKFSFVASLPHLQSLMWKTNDDSWVLKTKMATEMLRGLDKLSQNLTQLKLFFHIFDLFDDENEKINSCKCISFLNRLRYCPRLSSLEFGILRGLGGDMFDIGWPKHFVHLLVDLVSLNELNLQYFDIRRDESIVASFSIVFQRLNSLAVIRVRFLRNIYLGANCGPYHNLQRLKFFCNVLTLDDIQMLAFFVGRKCPNLVEIYFCGIKDQRLVALIMAICELIHPCCDNYVLNACIQPLKINYDFVFNHALDEDFGFKLPDLCAVSMENGRPVIWRTCQYKQ